MLSESKYQWMSCRFAGPLCFTRLIAPCPWRSHNALHLGLAQCIMGSGAIRRVKQRGSANRQPISPFNTAEKRLRMHQIMKIWRGI